MDQVNASQVFWVSIQQAATLLGVSDSALRQWMRSGAIPLEAIREADPITKRGAKISGAWIQGRLKDHKRRIDQCLALLASPEPIS